MKEGVAKKTCFAQKRKAGGFSYFQYSTFVNETGSHKTLTQRQTIREASSSRYKLHGEHRLPAINNFQQFLRQNMLRAL
jgi:hypothetical protein